MIAVLQQIVTGILVLGVLVLIHELGHFAMAKWCGIRVLSFSVGFGRPLLKKTVGGTEYKLSVIPVGGYVHMAGEHPEDEHEMQDDEYTSKPIWQRALVALAGPAANFISAFALLWFVFVAGVRQDIFLQRPIVGAVADSSIAAEAGFLAGDSIVNINGVQVKSWEDIDARFRLQDSPYTITFVRNGTERVLFFEVPVQKGFGIPKVPSAGLLPALPAIIGSINAGSPADSAGLKPGDEIRAIDSTTIHSWYQLSSLVAAYDTSRGPLAVRVQRGNTVFTVVVSPHYSMDLKRYLLGMTVGLPPSRVVRYGPLTALSEAVGKTGEYTVMIFDVLARLMTKRVSPKQLAGPIGIVQMSGVAALGGLSAVLSFMALIGINLAVLNLFPLIITDGGVLLFLLFEAIRGKPLSLRSQMLINKVAISLFIALFLFVTFNDIQRIPLLYRLFSK